MVKNYKSLILLAVLLLSPIPSSAEGEKSPLDSVPVEKLDTAPSAPMAETGLSASSSSTPIERAKGEKLATAMGHYGRARALLISAIREFDKGLALVDPNALLDSGTWRASVTERAEELARVLDPQPRATRGGIRFGNETRGIGDAGKK